MTRDRNFNSEKESNMNATNRRRFASLGNVRLGWVADAHRNTLPPARWHPR